MKIDPAIEAQFSAREVQPLRADDLFLPAIEEVVKHIARVAAESDYKHYQKTGKIPYNDPPGKEGTA